jgi:CDP-glycerol glycerophosphotransferase (TagB/SpsB family)
VSRLEYLVSAAILRVLGALCSLLPLRPRVVLATARTAALDGNLLALHREIRARRPDLECVLLLEPYSYGLAGKLAYAARLIRGMYLLRTSALFIVDNAYLPIHVGPHGARTTVVQVWHAVGALKRFGLDTRRPPDEPESTFLHRYYDWVVTTSEAARQPWSRALRTPPDHVLPLGTPRTDGLFDDRARAEARERVLRAYPVLRGRRVLVYAPTFRGRGRRKSAGSSLEARRLRAALPEDDVLVLKTHPNLDPAAISTDGFDVIVDPAFEINDLLAATDVLITDYSSSIFEYAVVRKPLVLLVGDLRDYESDPGLYLDYRTEMIGTQVDDTEGVIAAILADRFDMSGYDAFIARHLGASDGHSSTRFVERFVGAIPARPRPGGG